VNVNQDAERAREQLALARAKSDQLGKELRSRRQGDDPEWLRLARELSEWTVKEFDAEHAIAKAEDGTPGVTGTHGEYRWLSSVDHDISALLGLCPEVLLGRRIAVTSIDSGALRLTKEETSAGWWTAHDCRVYKFLPNGSREDSADWEVACSPTLQSVQGLPYETHDECCDGFDEWYVFEGEIPVSDFEVFVNWGGFRLYDPGYQWVIDRLWKQMAGLNAESYIAQGSVLTFATRNMDLFNAAVAALSADLRGTEGEQETRRGWAITS
jgi:hypothetical protein